MKKLFSLLLAAIMLLGMAGIAAADEINYDVTEPTKVVFWHTLNDEDDAALLERIIKEFEAEHPLITIEPVYYASYNKVNEALAAANVANVDVPGCAFINVPRLKAYADNGVIENLDPYIAHYGVDMSDFVQGFLDAMQVDGHQVAFPVMQSGQVAYYNADLLEQLGITFPEKWEDMDAYLEKVFTATGKPAISLPEWDNAYFYPIYSNLNAYMITTKESGEEVTGLDTEDALAVTRQMREWTDKGWINWFHDASSCRAAFTGGDSAGIMLYTTANYDNLQSKSEFTVAMAVPPAMKTGKNNQLVAGGTFIIPANNDQQIKNAAFQFINWFTSGKYTIDFCIATSYFPTRMSCLENEADMARFYEAMPAMPPVIKYLSSFEKKPQSAAFDSVGDIFENYMGQIMVERQLDVDTAWEMMIEEMNEYLADQN